MVFSLCLRQSLITRDQKESNREIKAGTTKYILNVMVEDDIFGCWFFNIIIILIVIFVVAVVYSRE